MIFVHVEHHGGDRGHAMRAAGEHIRVELITQDVRRKG